MSLVKVQGNASGTGIFTIASPNSNTDRTLTLPDQTGTLLTGSGAIGVNASAAANSLVVDASGNVGIGTSSPGTKLDVRAGSVVQTVYNTDATSNDSHSATIRAYAASTSYWNKLVLDGSRIVFNSYGTERAQIDGNGNLLVGTTDTTYTTGNGIKLLNSATGKNVVINAAVSTNGHEGFMMYSTGAAAYRFYVAWGGTIYATSTTITGISDVRLKENIRDLDDGLGVVMALKPRKFDWKEGKGQNIKNARGFIAQEFEQVLPDMVEEWRDPAPDGEDPYKAVNANLIPTLVKAIQELKAIVDAQGAEIAALKGQA
jgi:hypothetical protein